MNSLLKLDEWVISILADPITKLKSNPENFKKANGIIDARVYLKNSLGFKNWESGQDDFEIYASEGKGYNEKINSYQKEIGYDKPTYDYFKMEGSVLDVGGLTGTVREFLPKNTRFVSIDPYIEALDQIPQSKIKAYKCLSEKLNFIAALAEFIPFQAESFDWVHMRSMLDHVQVPDLALKEASRVLKPNGKLLVGISVEGGKTGRKTLKQATKDLITDTLGSLGFDKYKDHHTWHPTYTNLLKIISDNGFEINDSYWQPFWKDQVVYVLANKKHPF